MKISRLLIWGFLNLAILYFMAHILVAQVC